MTTTNTNLSIQLIAPIDLELKMIGLKEGDIISDYTINKVTGTAYFTHHYRNWKYDCVAVQDSFIFVNIH